MSMTAEEKLQADEERVVSSLAESFYIEFNALCEKLNDDELPEQVAEWALKEVPKLPKALTTAEPMDDDQIVDLMVCASLEPEQGSMHERMSLALFAARQLLTPDQLLAPDEAERIARGAEH